MNRDCSICGKERDEVTMKVFRVPEAERESLKKMGVEKPSDLYAYCRSCFRLLENRATAIQLMKGTLISQMRAAGVSITVAESQAEKFCNKLLTATPETPSS